MKVYKNVQALWQAPAGTVNNAFHSGQALAVRIVPQFLTTTNVGNYLPRTILATDNVKRNNQITIGDSGWFLIDRNFLQARDDDSDHPFARTVGPRATLTFGIEQAGAATTDTWNVWIAEDLLDILAGPAPLVQLTRDSTSGLFFPLQTSSGSSNVSVQNSIAINNPDTQLFDQTATASSALNTGTITTTGIRDIIVRISGLTAPTTRGLTVNGVRVDASVVPMWIPAAIAASITDAEYALGEGANIPLTPIGATSVGGSYSGPLPTQMQFNLSTGTDTPRMTIWGRNNS
jgi:hypothetical protein